MERSILGLLAAVVLPCVAWGLHVAVPPMAMPEFADTEASTNILVNVVRSDMRGLDVSVELCATPSNNVQVAFAELSAARPEWACRASWNLMRLTRRGTDMPAECFDVSFRYNVLHLIFR